MISKNPGKPVITVSRDRKKAVCSTIRFRGSAFTAFKRRDISSIGNNEAKARKVMETIPSTANVGRMPRDGVT